MKAGKADCILLGAVGTKKHEKNENKLKPESGLLALRKSLDLYINVRPIFLFDALLEEQFVYQIQISQEQHTSVSVLSYLYSLYKTQSQPKDHHLLFLIVVLRVVVLNHLPLPHHTLSLPISLILSLYLPHLE